jgi:hypothetical protein
MHTLPRGGLADRDMNFPKIVPNAQAKMVATQPRSMSQEDERCHRQRQRQPTIAEADEQSMAQKFAHTTFLFGSSKT